MKNKEEQEQEKGKVNGGEEGEEGKKGEEDKKGEVENGEEQGPKKGEFKKMKREEEDVLTTSSVLCSCTFSIQSELT